MAVEQSPGTARQAAQPVAADPRDAELETLRRERADTVAKHKADMDQVAAALRDPATVKALYDQVSAASGVSATAGDDDDTALVDKKELRRLLTERDQRVAGAIAETTAGSAREIRKAHKTHLRTALPKFTTYEAEVDALLDKMDPRQAAQAETITQVYQVVRSRHADEERAEMETELRQEIEADLRSKGWTPDEIEAEVEERVEAEIPDEPAPRRAASRAPEPAARRTGVAPSGDGAGSRIAPRRGSEQPARWADRDQRTAAGLFGITSPEEFKKYGDKNWKPDVMGFKGRERI